ncbi:hypothetical protein QQF64_026792 [Cirrhinus molitorella]|uniref:Secreted protein n=1 Tax=Cirrhinus molitorella TaxID=172907 RepID=A0ABR3NAJ8_9TELE
MPFLFLLFVFVSLAAEPQRLHSIECLWLYLSISSEKSASVPFVKAEVHILIFSDASSELGTETEKFINMPWLKKRAGPTSMNFYKDKLEVLRVLRVSTVFLCI